jgi:PKD repeat protein
LRHFAFIFVLLTAVVSGQVSEGGRPYTFMDAGLQPTEILYSFPVPDTSVALYEEMRSPGQPQPYRVAVGIPVDISLGKDAEWKYTADGKAYKLLAIEVEGASGIILYYSSFSIPEGGRLFVYNDDRSQLIGAFTSRNNPSGGYFATEMIAGDKILIEYNAPVGETESPLVDIYEVHYVYKDPKLWTDPSGDCEVNVNCPEGDAWQNEKQAVTRLVMKVGGGTFLCSGSLINNTRQDSLPLLLTARHCGSSATAQDYSQWVFHFNYEAAGCEEPTENPPSSTLTGASFLAAAPDGTSNGSDFKLIQLDQMVPESYNPYFAGWSRSGMVSQTGVGIHHPKGAPKKISTYINPLVSCDYGQSGENPNGMYWRVVWSETETSHGVTEGGSSGSPIFDNTGKIVGTLTGGAAACSNLSGPDFYGKMSYHWESNGISSDAQLQPFLDPDNTGVQSLEGFGYGSRLIANFSADTTSLSVGGSVLFADKSSGEPESWQWFFPGGDPSKVYSENPGNITYRDYGTYDVKLIVSNGTVSDTLMREKYIKVTPNLYPVPADETLTIDFGRREVEYIHVEIYDVYGSMVRKLENSSTTTGVWTISVGDLHSGPYFLRIMTNVQEDQMPVVVIY